MSMRVTADKSAKTQNGITEGVIWQQLLLFFFPILFGTFFQQLYNTVDAVIVGQFVGKEALAAVGGTTGTLINLFVGFFVGLSSGAAVTISQFYGAGNREKVKEAVHTAIAFSMAAGCGMMLLGLMGAPLALKGMGAPQEIMAPALVYLRIYFCGMMFNLTYNMGAAILRAVGDSKKPLYFLIASCLTNIVLDILLVVYFRMGVMGVGIATVVSQFISALLVILTLLRTQDCYQLFLREVRIQPDMLVRIVKIGFPAGLQSAMYNISNIIIQASVNTLGTDTIAAWTAFGKVDTLFWMMINSFGIAITTFVGQNYGARKNDRVRKGIRVCLLQAFIATVLMCSTMYIFGYYILRLFTKDAVVLDIGVSIMHFMVPTFVTYILVEIYSGSLRATGDCWIPMLITCVGVCILRVVWIIIAVPVNRSIQTIIFSYPLTWVVSSILFLIYFHGFSKFKIKSFRIPR